MASHPHTVVVNKVAQLSEKYHIPPATVDALLGEFVEALHETTFKGSQTDTLLGIHFSLGPQTAWHFWGLIYRGLQGNDGEFLSDSRGMWYETAIRLDSEMKQFATILERWSEEQACELEQDGFEEQDRK